MRGLFLAAALGSLASSPLHAATTVTPQSDSPAVLSLDAAIKNFAVPDAPSERESAERRALVAAGATMDEWRTTQSQLTSLQAYLGNNDYGTALRQARQYARQANSPEVKQRWRDLIAALEAEQKKIETAAIEAISDAIARSAETLLAARKPADLDPLLDHFASLQENRHHNASPRIQRAYSRLGAAENFTRQWQDLLNSHLEGDTETARQVIRNLSGGSTRDRVLSRSQILSFAATLGLNQATVTEALEHITPIIQEAADAALAATNAEALDSHLLRLEELKEMYRSNYDGPLRRVNDRLDASIHFFRQWQDFISLVEHGEYRDARQFFRNFNNNSARFRPISRGAALDRANALLGDADAETTQLLDDLDWKTLPLVRARVTEAQEGAYGRRSTELSRVVTELDRLAAAREALDSGRAGLGRAVLRTSVSTSSCSGTASAFLSHPKIVALREAWWFEAMPALTGLPDLPPRKANETALDYVTRELDAALADSNWVRAYRFAVVQRDLLPSDAAPCGEREKIAGANPGAALRAFLKAEKFESAGQSEAAAAAYREALAAGAPPMLENLLIQRLRKLAGSPASIAPVAHRSVPAAVAGNELHDAP